MSKLPQKNARILFQGDSITDCQRVRDDEKSMGDGYAAIIAGTLAALYPENNYTFINKGISGNRVTHLVEPWQAETLDLKPNVLTLLIGVNDTHLQIADAPQSPSHEQFRQMLLGLIRQAQAQNPELQVIMMEPFLVPSTHESAAWIAGWQTDLLERIELVRSVAREVGARLVPLHGLFASAIDSDNPPEEWALDGVHPTVRGHRLIAGALMKELGVCVEMPL